MILQFDGSLPGFLTAVFEGYPYRKNLILENRIAPSFLPDTRPVFTEEEKAARVLSYLRVHFPRFVSREFKWGVLTEEDDLWNDLGQTIYAMMDQGGRVLYSDQKSPRAVMKNAKRLSSECHSYKGLLRFRELKGGVLYGPFRPRGNIIYPLAGHFKDRMPKETFLLHDVARNIGLLHDKGEIDLVEIQEIEENWSQEERQLQDLWRAFSQSVSIGARKNLKLQKSNMPKRYWEFLTEKQGKI